MGYIKNLAYMGLEAADIEAWREFGTNILGMQESKVPSDPDTLLLRMDSRVYRMAIHKGTDRAVRYLGFEVATTQDLAAFGDQLRASGVDVKVEDASVCATRRVAAMQSTTDPMGNRLEFFVGHEEATDPFVSPTGAEFVIDDMGIGHAFISTHDMDETIGFYVDKLGFLVSDTVSLQPGNPTYFLHCNPRHHTLAIAKIPGIPPFMHHIMLQVASIDTVGYAMDKPDIVIESTLGKHVNDHMVTFFCKAPSGLSIEYGIDGRRIDDETWVVGHYTAVSYWGHQRPALTPA